MAVVRVKRRCDEEPSDILVLACKIRKTENCESATSVFKLAATVNDQEDKALHCPHSFKTDAEATIKSKRKRDGEAAKKLRAEHQASSKRRRYRVVNLYRSLKENEIQSEVDEVESSEDVKKPLTVLEVESNVDVKVTGDSSANDVSGSKYVYDLYYAADGVDFDDLQLEQIDSVHGLGSELMHEYRNGGGSDSDRSMEDDDDDSNDENNWRNDYPDEEEDYFNGGDDGNSFEDEDESGFMGLSSRMRGFKISDDEEEEEEEESSDEDVVYNNKLDVSDISHFGKTYAKYKAKLNKEDYDSTCSVNSDSD